MNQILGCIVALACIAIVSGQSGVTSNPFQGRNFYVNPSYQAELTTSIQTSTDATTTSNLQHMMNIPSAYWLDTMSKINGAGSTSTAEGILADAASKSPAPLVVFIVYDLPNRDCHAKASNGEICCTTNSDGTCDYNAGGDCADGLTKYKTNYIDPLVTLFKSYQDRVPIIAVIEPDSLPNLATNMADPHCSNTATQNAYKTGVAYAVNQLATNCPKVALYVDAAHGGWLGWQNNLDSFVQIIQGLNIISSIRGFSNNVANYQTLGQACPQPNYCLPSAGHTSDPCCADPCKLITQYNPANNEYNYVMNMADAFKSKTGWTPYFITDTGRNGVANERSDCANWCNIRGAGVGVEPTTNTGSTLIDAFYWLKTPGESDGCTQVLPDGTNCARYDSMCGSTDSLGSNSGEPRAPLAGKWFDYQVKMLAKNAIWSGQFRGTSTTGSNTGNTVGTTSGGGSTTGTTTGSAPSSSSSATISPIPGTTTGSTTGGASSGQSNNALKFTGVNEAGAEFGDVGGSYGSAYLYPTTASIDYFVNKGMNVFRVPFRWERIQPNLSQDFDPTELSRLTSLVSYIESKGAHTILDPHNYARYNGKLVGSDIPNSVFADFWGQLATKFSVTAGYDNVIFGLMNEPNSMPTEQWVGAAQAAIDKIRSLNIKNLILVPGNAWTGAHSWTESWYGTPNAQAMLSITDPINNYAIEVHQYLDGDSSGTSYQCVSSTIGPERMAAFTNWARTNNKKAVLGEFAGGNNPACQVAIQNLLSYLDSNGDVYLGWTWWAAGPMWGSYMYSIEPTNNGAGDQAQMAWLSKFMQSGSATNKLPSSSEEEGGGRGGMPWYGAVLITLASICLCGVCLVVVAVVVVVVLRKRNAANAYARLSVNRLDDDAPSSGYRPPQDL